MGHGLHIKQKNQLHPIRIFILLVLALSLIYITWITFRWYTRGVLPPYMQIRYLQADPTIDESDVTEVMRTSHIVAKNEPRYISIPQLSAYDARVISTGIDDNNFLGMPKNINDAGWYNKSIAPGFGYGVVVITGHTYSASQRGLFNASDKLAPGAKIFLQRGDGVTTTYRVVNNQTMSLKKFSEKGIKTLSESPDSTKESLCIVIASGNWIPQLKQYDQRRIIRAVSH